MTKLVDTTRVTTTFQMPDDLKHQLSKFVHKKDASLSHIIEKALDDFLEGSSPVIKEKLADTSAYKSYTSIIIPTDIRDKAKMYAAQYNISFGDLIRYVLILYLESKNVELN